jgi:hypothetical protein
MGGTNHLLPHPPPVKGEGVCGNIRATHGPTAAGRETQEGHTGERCNR